MEFTFTFTVGDDNTTTPPTTASTSAGNSEMITMSSLP